MASPDQVAGRRSGRTMRLTGNLLIAIGAILLIGVGVTWVYSQYLGWEAAQQSQVDKAAAQATRTAVVQATQTAAALAALDPTATPTPVQTPLTIGGPPLTATPAATATPRPPEWVTAEPPIWISAKKIDLDSKVVISEVKDGTWDVPKFVAGYLDGTSRPSQEGGNVVLSGHIQSLTSGNVFARIGELEWGDRIFLETTARQFEYEVTEKRIVKPDAVEVTFPSVEPKVTLITCTGDWDPIKRDYTQRLIIFGKLVAVDGQKVS